MQSIGRALQMLEVIADAGGQMSLSELASVTGMPVPTIHRILRTLVDCGYVRQLPNRRYALDARLIPLGEAASAMLGQWARPVLAELVEALGETANLAVFDGDLVMYTCQVPSKHSMRMFTEVGRRVFAHSTGAGKALLSQLSDEEVRNLVGRTGLPAETPNTITDVDVLSAQLQTIREQGYAMDEGEQEVGVRCVAVPVQGAATRLSVSVSGPEPRMTPELVERALPMLERASKVLTGAFPDHRQAAGSRR
ncbi:IclR family transcriptional regulator [Modestobacter lapidis]|nr:IclR family transcriptional regulator [Modestobacter lapidis]